MNGIIEKLRAELKQNADPKILQSTDRFFKEKVYCYGYKTADISKLGKEYFKVLKELPKSDIFRICDELWKSQYLEETFIACQWAYALNKQFEVNDFKTFERWVKNYVTNWASCDTLCNHTIGKFIEMYPEYIQKLLEWTKSDNRWVRRAAAVTLIIPARKGMFLKEIFEIAESLFYDKDDLVQKGYGWMLKAASEANQKEVFDWVMSKKLTMPRTSLRYAIEKMPKELKSMAMKK
jgi:3-methyladenine DNA glycosylase AlkD